MDSAVTLLRNSPDRRPSSTHLIGGQLLDSGDREFQLGGVVTEGGALGDTGRFGNGSVDYPVVPVSRQSPQGRRGESLVDRFVLLPSAAHSLAGDGWRRHRITLRGGLHGGIRP